MERPNRSFSQRHLPYGGKSFVGRLNSLSRTQCQKPKAPDFVLEIATDPRSWLLNWGNYSSVHVPLQFKAVDTLHAGISLVLNFLEFLGVEGC